MEENAPVKKQANKEKLPLTQVFAAVVCNLGQVSCGISIGWLSPAIPQMKASGILEEFDQEELLKLFSWLAGASGLVAIFFTPFAAFVSEGLGRRTCAALTGVPFAINAIILLSTTNIYWLLAGRFIIGVGVALSVGNNQVFIGEAVSPNVRGKLGSLMALGYTFGTLFAYLVGGFISYTAAGILMLAVALSTIFLFFFIPETPAWLVTKGKTEAAIKSIAWFRRKNQDDPEVKQELNALIEAAKIELPSRIQAMKLLIHSKPIRRGFLICLFAIVSLSWDGLIAIHGFSVSIFIQSGAWELSPEGASAILGSLQVMGAASTVFMVETFGRKFLYAASSMCLSLCMFSMGVYFHLQNLNVDLSYVQWLPVTALSLCVYTYTVGVGSVPFILLADLLPNEVRSSATMIVMLVFNIDLFIILFFFERVVETVGPHPVFYFFGSMGALTFIISLLIVPETKGKNTEEIMKQLSR